MSDQSLEDEIYQKILDKTEDKAGIFTGIARKFDMAPSKDEAREMAKITAAAINDFKNPINLLLGFLSGGNMFDRLEGNVRNALEEAGYGKWADDISQDVAKEAQERMGNGGIFSFLGGGQEQGPTQVAEVGLGGLTASAPSQSTPSQGGLSVP